MIEPRTFKGTRDLLPAEQAPREALIDRLKTVFRRYGFAPLETPAMELQEILGGKYGEDVEKLIFKLAYKDGNTLALRYDLTIPLARVMAMNPQLIKPFKRYQIQPVWRADNPQIRQGRFREFMQCDVDIVGTSSLLADAEIIMATYDSLKAIGFGDDDNSFTMRINNRSALAGLCEFVDLSGKEIIICKAIDKWDKIKSEGVHKELIENGIPLSASTKIVDLVGSWEPKTDMDPRWCAMLEQTSSGRKGFLELMEVSNNLRMFGLDESSYIFDPKIARGLDYYTGTIYETTLEKAPHIGSLTGGGRYDNLIGLFTNQSIPAVGTTVGLDRILSAMETLNIKIDAPMSSEIMITVFDKEGLDYSISLAKKLREAGRRVELSYMIGNIGKQLELCDKKKIPFAIIAGPDERARGEVSIKDLRNSTQIKVPVYDLEATILTLL